MGKFKLSHGVLFTQGQYSPQTLEFQGKQNKQYKM